jgi:hypothetical protein
VNLRSNADPEDVFSWRPSDVAHFLRAAGLDAPVAFSAAHWAAANAAGRSRGGSSRGVDGGSGSSGIGSGDGSAGGDLPGAVARTSVGRLAVRQRVTGWRLALLSEGEAETYLGAHDPALRRSLLVWARSLLLRSLRAQHRCRPADCTQWSCLATAAWLGVDLSWLGMVRELRNLPPLYGPTWSSLRQARPNLSSLFFFLSLM